MSGLYQKPKNLKAYNQRYLTRISLGAYYSEQITEGEPELNLDQFGLKQNPNQSEFCRLKERTLFFMTLSYVEEGFMKQKCRRNWLNLEPG